MLRINATLLVREQVALIREARARLAAGKPVEAHDSVLPNLRWELIADAEKNTVKTRLIGAPQWLANEEMIPPTFWPIPIDGSIAWEFRPSAASARN
jgi:hypothetical protein